MKETYIVFQNETDNSTYSENTFVKAFNDESVAEYVADQLQKQVGYITRFSEERTFFVKKRVIQEDKDLSKVNSILKEIKKEFDW